MESFNYEKKVIYYISLIIVRHQRFGAKKEARKVDEFGNISCDDLSARLDNFSLQIKELKDSKGYILVYEGNVLKPLYNKNGTTAKPHRGEARAQIMTMKTRFKFLRFDDTKIVFVNGGFRKNFTVERLN